MTDETFDTPMTAEECRKAAKRSRAIAWEASNYGGDSFPSKEMQQYWEKRGRAARLAAAEWERAAVEVEKRERGDG